MQGLTPVDLFSDQPQPGVLRSDRRARPSATGNPPLHPARSSRQLSRGKRSAFVLLLAEGRAARDPAYNLRRSAAPPTPDSSAPAGQRIRATAPVRHPLAYKLPGLSGNP